MRKKERTWWWWIYLFTSRHCIIRRYLDLTFKIIVSCFCYMARDVECQLDRFYPSLTCSNVIRKLRKQILWFIVNRNTRQTSFSNILGVEPENNIKKEAIKYTPSQQNANIIPDVLFCDTHGEENIFSYQCTVLKNSRGGVRWADIHLA